MHGRAEEQRRGFHATVTECHRVSPSVTRVYHGKTSCSAAHPRVYVYVGSMSDVGSELGRINGHNHNAAATPHRDTRSVGGEPQTKCR